VRSLAIVRKPGFADLYVTREERHHYEAAEIASIENILAQRDSTEHRQSWPPPLPSPV